MSDVLMGCGMLFLCNLTLLKGLETLTLSVVVHIFKGSFYFWGKTKIYLTKEDCHADFFMQSRF